MTDHTGGNINIYVHGPVADGRALGEAIVRAIEAGRVKPVADAAPISAPTKLPWWRRWFRWR